MTTSDDNIYIVYKVSAPATDLVYYSYSKSEDLKKAFLAGAKRQDNPDRGDVKMLNAAGNEEDLRFTMMDVFNDEIEAFITRNDLRTQDAMSVTGPSNFPGTIFERIVAMRPEAPERWKVACELSSATVREAMLIPESGYTFNDVKSLRCRMNKAQAAALAKDVDVMLHPQFKQKYFSTNNKQ